MRVLIAAVLAAYLVGAVSFPYLIGRAYGVDLRAVGSRKLGGSNLVHAVGLVPGVVAGLLDAAKGAAAVLAAHALGLGPEAELACGLAAVAGQLWPVFHRFDGGRANATGWGALLALDLAASAAAAIPLAAAALLQLSIRPRPRRVLPVAALLTFAVWPAVIWESEGLTAQVAFGLAVLALILLRRLTAGLAADLATGAPLARVLANRMLFDRSELQERGLVAL